MKKINYYLIAVLWTISSYASAAKCTTPDLPLIPDGNIASEIEIQAAKIAVKAFIADLNDYRTCITKDLESLGETASEESKNKWQKKYNNSVDSEEYVVDSFNMQLRLFKSKSDQ